MKQAVIDVDQSVESGKGSQGLLRLREYEHSPGSHSVANTHAQSSYQACDYHF